LALALSVIYVYGPLSLEDAGKPRWLEDINVLLNKSFVVSKPEVLVSRSTQSPPRLSTRT
jgi:hypothetical protein